MTDLNALTNRASGKCELCSSAPGTSAFDVGRDQAVLVCDACSARLEGPTSADVNAWRCLAESMWSEHAPVQVLAYRVLKGLSDQAWAQDLAGQLYFDEDTQAWADSGLSTVGDDGSAAATTVDANGTPLAEGDTVTLIKDLDVKGGGFTAKRGTTVKGINLTDDTKYVEGRVNGIRIVLVAAYLKKA